MPGATLPPDQARSLASTIARIERIERRTIARPGEPAVHGVFSYPGGLASGIQSPPWYPPRGGNISLVRVSLLANATSDHVIEIRVDGSVIEQHTLTTGNKTVVDAAAIPINPESYVTVKTITVTDSDMTVNLTLA